MGEFTAKHEAPFPRDGRHGEVCGFQVVYVVAGQSAFQVGVFRCGPNGDLQRRVAGGLAQLQRSRRYPAQPYVELVQFAGELTSLSCVLWPVLDRAKCWPSGGR